MLQMHGPRHKQGADSKKLDCLLPPSLVHVKEAQLSVSNKVFTVKCLTESLLVPWKRKWDISKDLASLQRRARARALCSRRAVMTPVLSVSRLTSMGEADAPPSLSIVVTPGWLVVTVRRTGCGEFEKNETSCIKNGVD